MSSQRKQVLNMIAEGKISAEEASRLLDKLESAHPGQPEQEPPGNRSAASLSDSSPGRREESPSPEDDKLQPVTGKKKALKFLRVLVDSDDGDIVNVRVPLALIRTGIKMSTMLPQETNEKLNEKGVDLSYLNGLGGEDLIEALRELEVEVDSASGDKVRIFCE